MKKIAAIIMTLTTALTPAVFVMAQEGAPAKAVLAVPYVSEVPDGRWVGSWKNACEEASIAMVDRFYAGDKKATKTWARNYMTKLFVIQRKLWGSDANSDIKMTARLINDNSSFSGRVVADVTVDQIKAELAAGRPVIAPINGFTLANKNIPFLASGSGFHMFVIVGFDDATGDFIVNDNGDTKTGVGIRYSYDRVMRSLHDYIFATQKTNGPQRAIFTYPKLAKTAASHRIYYLHDGIKQYVSHPLVFGQRGWSWAWVNTVSADFLASFKDEAVIRPR